MKDFSTRLTDMIRILIPLDGSRAAEESLKHAQAFAKCFPAELTLLRAVADASANAVAHVDCVDFALWKYQAQAYLRGLQEKYESENLQINCEVAEGNPEDAIIRCMSRSKPDLLIISRFGRGNARNFAIGGTAQKVLWNSTCSILLIDPRCALGPEQRYRRILVAVDDDSHSECTLAIGGMLAEIHGASLLLLQVVEEPRLPRNSPATLNSRQLAGEMRRILESEAERRLKDLAKRLSVGLDIRRRVLFSPEASIAIESVAEEENCDLLLLHNRDPGMNADRSFDAINHSLIQYSHKALFIFRPDEKEGFGSNFRSVYMYEPQREAG